jgi:nucleoside 2-deoxyribosyltransferase
MIITICSSLYFAKEIGEVAEKLRELGYEVFMPSTAEQVLSGKIDLADIKKEKESGIASERFIKDNAIINHYKKIERSDAILALNYEKKGIKNYIGGAVFLEIGFAFVLGKKIFLWNDIPDMLYTDEIKAMQPIILNGDISKIK